MEDHRSLASPLAARLVVITRPLSRISPPVWSSITARLVAFPMPNYLNIRPFCATNLEIKEKLNFCVVNNFRLWKTYNTPSGGGTWST